MMLILSGNKEILCACFDPSKFSSIFNLSLLINLSIVVGSFEKHSRILEHSLSISEGCGNFIFDAFFPRTDLLLKLCLILFLHLTLKVTLE
jgi:hypothetical protein